MKLGDRQKLYEQIISGQTLIPNLPILARCDGKAFHTWTRGMDRPFDVKLQHLFDETTKFLIEQTNAVIGYTQSDEISLVIWNYNKIDSDVLFSGNIAKLNSVVTSIATAKFNDIAKREFPEKSLAFFDCRVWNVPTTHEVVNYLIWREQDAVRNSIQSAAQSFYSSKQLHKKNSSELHELLHEKGINWNDYPARFKRGAYFRRILEERYLTDEELSRIPEKFRKPDELVKRHSIKEMNYPVLSSIENRVDVIFENTKWKLFAEKN